MWIEGMRVFFPYEPYDEQLIYMRDLLVALKSEQNCALEAPTGFGKSLCLTSVLLSYQHVLHVINNIIIEALEKNSIKIQYAGAVTEVFESCDFFLLFVEEAKILSFLTVKNNDVLLNGAQDFKIPKIIYTSRTHEELQQIMQSIKHVALKTTIGYLGARDRYCINIANLKANEDLNIECRYQLKNNGCPFFDSTRINNSVGELQIIEEAKCCDIEDFVSYCKKKEMCPYFFSHAYAKTANVVITPYNYIFTSQTMYSDLVSDSIVVVDEAHNLGNICMEEFEQAISLNDLEYLLGCMQFIISEPIYLQKSDLKAEVVEQYIRLLKVLVLNENELLSLVSFEGQFREEQYFKFELSEFFKNIALKPEELSLLQESTIEVESVFQNNIRVKHALKVIPKYGLLNYLLQMYKLAKQNGDAFCILITEQEEQQDMLSSIHIPHTTPALLRELEAPKEKYQKIFKIICLNPSPVIEILKSQNVKQFILTSGTLSPLQSLDNEFRIEFEFRHSYNEISKSSNYYIIKSVRQQPIVGTYENRQQSNYISSITEIIVSTMRNIVSGGVIVFFTSYSLLEQYCPIIKQQIPDAFFESKDEGKTLQDINNFKAQVELAKGLFLAVLRGRLAEGADFPDNQCRVSIVISLPFAPIKDPLVIERQKYCREEYLIDACRAVSEAAGRAIRHSKDFGMVLLVDSRFEQYKAFLPQWAQNMLVKDFETLSFEDLNSEIVAYQNEAASNKTEGKRPSFVNETPKDAIMRKIILRKELMATVSSEESILFEKIWKESVIASETNNYLEFEKYWEENKIMFNSDQICIILELFSQRLQEQIIETKE